MRHLILLTILFVAGCSQSVTYDRKPLKTKHSEEIVAAYAYYGFTETKNRAQIAELTGIDPVETEWCAAFVNAVLEEVGKEGSATVSAFPLTARSFMTWGKEVKKPQSGDVVVFPRGEPWQGHVGFYVKTAMVDGVENYLILGGNQNNQVSLEYYPASKALTIRRHLPQPL